MKQKWEMDASNPSEYHCVEARRGREFILRLKTGAEIVQAVQKFAEENHIKFAKIHAAFMGGLKPVKFAVWSPDTNNPDNIFHESTATVHNLSMVLSMGGMIEERSDGQKRVTFSPTHFVAGAGWDVPTFGGHLIEGIVQGTCEFFITEILGIDILLPSDAKSSAQRYPENWFKQVKDA